MFSTFINASILTNVSTEIWCLNNTCFNLEIATTLSEKKLGFMYRQKIQPFRGIKFNWEKEKIRYMWMKNTVNSLDILWLNSENRIIDYKQNVPPNNTSIISSNKKAKSIIELSSGSILSYSIKIGDTWKQPTF